MGTPFESECSFSWAPDPCPSVPSRWPTVGAQSEPECSFPLSPNPSPSVASLRAPIRVEPCGPSSQIRGTNRGPQSVNPWAINFGFQGNSGGSVYFSFSYGSRRKTGMNKRKTGDCIDAWKTLKTRNCGPPLMRWFAEHSYCKNIRTGISGRRRGISGRRL